MPKHLSIYLSMLRTVAAFAVFVTHANNFVFPHFGYLANHGGEAVACFFVLSGFLISFAATSREPSASEYVIARCARILPVLTAAIILTPILDMCGMSIDAANYVGKAYYSKAYGFGGIMSLTFLNEMWSSHFIYGTDEPIWSLGFEVPYYLFLGLFLFLKGPKKIVGLTVACIIIGPKVLMYMPIWLMGALIFHVLKTNTILIKSHWWAISVFILTIVGYVFFRKHFSSWGIFHYWEDTNILRTWLYFMFIGVIISLNIIAVSALQIRHISERFAMATHWLAGGTFTLYLLHQPILIFLSTIVPVSGKPVNGALCCAVAVVLCFVVAEIVERPKTIYRNLFRRILLGSLHTRYPRVIQKQ